MSVEKQIIPGKNGGWRPGSGRKKRMEEEELINKLSPLEPLFFDALEHKLKEKDSKGMELFAKYFLGEPLKQVKTTIEGNLSGLSVEIINRLDEAKDTSQ